MTEQNRNYTAKDIQVLEGLEPVRLRPGMYIGSTSATGLHHLVYEVVDNSIDEALAGVCDTINVEIHKDGSLSVIDNGSGIPVDKHPKTGISALETVLTKLHAGGKFDNSAYKVSGGLHGVGVSVVNALSEWLVATVHRDGYEYSQKFERGIKVCDIDKGKKIKGTGTKIHFKPDPQIFDTVIFEKDVLVRRFREMAFLNKGITITLRDDRDDTDETFYYEGGIKSFVEYINRKKTPIHEDVIYVEGKREESEVEVAIQYTDSYSENVISFANNIHTTEGGTHLSGFRSALTRCINDYGRSKNIIKEKEENLSGEDVREGITAIVSIKLFSPQFEGQTKAKLGNGESRGIVDSILYEGIATYLEEHPQTGKNIIEKALSSQRARMAARKARDLTRKRSILDNTPLPGKLADCSETDIEVNEIYLVEGDSAGGSAKSGRDSTFQAILPLRGKILNIEKARLDRILNSDEIKAMITAFGTGIGQEFSLDNLRYGKIIIMTDADVDGAHIMTLLLTFFYRFMRPLIENGHVYIAQPPLYGIIRGTKVIRYCYSDEELDQYFRENERGHLKIQRYKGLGEMNAEDLWSTTMDPDNRVLLRVNIDEENKISIDETFSVLMGEKVEPRREFIEENARYVKNIDA